MRTPMDRPRSPDLAARLFGAKPEHTLALLRAAWPGAVGDELARRTEVVALDHGVLRIKVPDMRWQRTLVRMRGFILERLRRVAGRAAPRGLGFVIGEVAGPAASVPEAPRIEAVTTAPAAVAEAAEAIPDPEIRQAFVAAAGRYLARFGPAQDASDAGGPDSGGAAGPGAAKASGPTGT